MDAAASASGRSSARRPRRCAPAIGRSGAVAYAPCIASSPDDLSSQLERLFDSQPEADEHVDPVEPSPMSVVRADPSPPPAPSSLPMTVGLDAAVVVDALRTEIDELCQQLDVAFDEVVGRVDRVELRLATLRTDAHQEAGSAAAERHEMLARLDHLVTTIDDAVAASHEPSPAGGPTVDLAPVAARLGQLDERLATKLTESRLRLEGGLDQLHQQIAELRDAPIELDTSTLEAAASRGSLHNAADIANLRTDIEALAQVVRRQDDGIGELRATLDWIKERLLLR